MDDLIKEAATNSLRLPDNKAAWTFILEFFTTRGYSSAAANSARQDAWQARREMRRGRQAPEAAAAHPSVDDAVELSDVMDAPEPVPAKPGKPLIGLGVPGQKWGVRSLF